MPRSGVVEIDRPMPGVVTTRMTGHARAEHVEPIKRAVNQEIAAGRRPHVFHDWSDMTGYDSEARVAMADWYAKVRDHVASVNVLAKNRLVAMGSRRRGLVHSAALIFTATAPIWWVVEANVEVP